MNTTRRGKKNQDITKSVGEVWNKRLEDCMEKAGYNRESFARAFKRRYGTGNSTDVYRWLHVGRPRGTQNAPIGFPSYDTMKRIADFFGVTVGYLTGETDYETFELEKTCAYLGIDAVAASSIKSFGNGSESILNYDRFWVKNQRKALNAVLASDNFKILILHLCLYADAVYKQNHPISYIKNALEGINPEIIDSAMEWINCYPGWQEDYMDVNSVEPTPELINAVKLINEAEDKEAAQPYLLEREVKLVNYDLQETLIRLRDEVACDENLELLTVPTVSSIKELKEHLKETS